MAQSEAQPDDAAEATSSADNHGASEAADGPSTGRAKKKRSWKRIALELGVVAAIFLGVRAYQSRDAAVGPAPALTARTIDDSVVELQGDEPVLVHFWATWCGVCEAEEGNVRAVSESSRVISIASQSGARGAVAAYARSHDLDFPIVNDPSGALAHRWGVSAFPTSFIVDPDGEIRHVEVGYTTSLGLRARLWLASL